MLFVRKVHAEKFIATLGKIRLRVVFRLRETGDRALHHLVSEDQAYTLSGKHKTKKIVILFKLVNLYYSFTRVIERHR